MTTYLLTGGTGSYGRAFIDYAAKHVLQFGDTLRVFSRDENKQAAMRSELETQGIRFLIGDVRNRERVYRAIDGCDVVIHAAAMKSVPECENNPHEAVLTNITGTQNVIDAAIDVGVHKVVLISTDKAAAPSNLYGATKLVAESLFTHANTYVGDGVTRFASVRCGNLSGSRGSVVPIWQALPDSEAAQVTDPSMTRFWMSLEDAVRFTFATIDEMHGGEVFVPNIPALRVGDLHEAVRPGKRYDVTGARPGERRHETLITDDELPRVSEMASRSMGFIIHTQRNHAPLPLTKPFTSDQAVRMSIEEIRVTL